jgi:hypothetical protein
MTVQEKLRRCRICGFTGSKVSPGIYKTRDGRYITVNRCEDHLACDSRKAAI